jgi:hypothetical protein
MTRNYKIVDFACNQTEFGYKLKAGKDAEGLI